MEEALEGLWIRVESVGQELEGDGLPELQVVGPVDLAHAPLSQQARDAVAAGQEEARKEPCLRRGGEGGAGRREAGVGAVRLIRRRERGRG